MKAAWGNKWCSHLDQDNLANSMLLWHEKTLRLSDEQLTKGIGWCEDNCDFPPSIAQFKKACLGIMSPERAWAARTSDPIAKRAYESCDSWTM